MPAHAATTHLQGPLVRIAGAASIPSLLRSLGADPAAVFAAAGVDIALLDDPDNLLALEAMGRLFGLCVKATGCEHFGLRVGQKVDLTTLGIIGLAARHAPDVASALDRLRTLIEFHNGGAVLALEVDGQTATLAYCLHDPNGEGLDQIEHAALAALFNVMSTLCGHSWRPIEVRCALRRPKDITQYRGFFRAPIRFDAERDTLVFRAKWLDHQLPSVDSALQRLIQRQVATLESNRAMNFPDQVRAVLRTALQSGSGTAEQVAALLSMHPRTLARRLAVHGTSFKLMADQGRFALARQMLRSTALDIGQIAASLDYSDASAFTRAFRRWSGTTPAVWRLANTTGPIARQPPVGSVEQEMS